MFPEIPGFKITKVLGEGPMAKVYLAMDEALERKVALDGGGSGTDLPHSTHPGLPR